MMLVTRDGKLLQDNNSKDLPGDVYKMCLNNDGYVNNYINDAKLALNTSKKELSLIFNGDNSIKTDEYIFSIVLPDLINKNQIVR